MKAAWPHAAFLERYCLGKHRNQHVREQGGHLMKAAGSPLGGEFKGHVQPLNEDAGEIPVIATGSEQWKS